MFDTQVDPQLEWLYHVGPVGLVIGPNVIREEGLNPPHQTAVDTRTVAELLDADGDGPVLTDPWVFFERILGWEARYVAGAPGGPALPTKLAARVDEHDVVLSPDWAVRDLGGTDPEPFQVLVKLHTDLEADKRGALDGWEATPHQQFERLLRETGVAIGVLIDRSHLRLIYAPRGETSGWLSFPLRSLATVAGRAMLAGVKLMLGHARLFTEPEPRRLPKLFARSREAQNKVSAELAEQVLGALHELLRAFHAADRERIEHLAATRPHHLYEGLLTTLMRLVFLLYAEDRDMIPTMRTGEAVEIYEQGYSVRGLYARLTEDRALNPDTMDERVGGWGRLLALFRLVHGGHPSGWITARGGKLFDPNVFPLLEGRDEGDPLTAAKVLPIRDGAILRILELLMTIEARAITGDRVRERLSYRSLDVEQIGSVYETIMGFTVLRAPGRMIAVKGEKNLPVFVDIDALAAKKGADRQKLLKDVGVSPTGKRLEAIKRAEGAQELTEALAVIAEPRGSPGGHVTVVGSPILQPTDDRRRSGSHYTPRSLTEPIVRHALEAAFERIGVEATPDQVLEIKVCDPACGSGAFLVEACRQLGERLEKAWGRHPDLKPKIPADEDEALHARRLVAQRSLYGVDKNPLAVDLARLSLWLATLAREHEFTFLDHAIKSGDSLVGLTRAQIEAAHWDETKNSAPLFRGLVHDRVNEATTGRREIQFASDDVTRAIQEARHRVVERRLDQPRMYGDALVAAFFSAQRAKAREEARVEVAKLLSGSGTNEREDRLAAVAATLRHGEHPIRPFHWELEFPEVFSRDNSGFDAMVGNPPFLGGKRISTELGDKYPEWLSFTHSETNKNTDLVGQFFLRSFDLLRHEGALGLIATSTIQQGDTREGSISVILRNGGRIFRAIRRKRWPGDAAVIVSELNIIKGSERQAFLDGKPVHRVSAYLVSGDYDSSPHQISANDGRSFIGSILLGMGFTFDDSNPDRGQSSSIADLERMTSARPILSTRIHPYLGGEEVNTDPRQASHRFAFDLSDLSEEDALLEYPELMEIAREKVKPVRDQLKRGVYRDKWWRFGEPQFALYEAARKSEYVLGISRVTAHVAFAFLPSETIFADTVVVITNPSQQMFSVLQSRLHENWARYFSSTLGQTLRYGPTDCFRTFPFPVGYTNDEALGLAGQAYHDFRAQFMVARNEGMTKTYNRFHDANGTSTGIVRLRELHADMDRAVLRAYGWDDLADRAQPQFLTEETEDDHTYQGRLFWPSDVRDEVLARLLKLNAERHEDEVQLGLAKAGSIRASEEDELEDAAE
ncbi:hypothetical protein B2M20_09155 [Nitrobacter vulgaris]|uniref:site-specific DNA-methyltransferase (adenine-specific) n=2 Tax=Nitrobacter vulgaris TaxID=29421 RepID=A0A1V4HZ69_NITVU|nr:hypothetical protein B2M20_09155 [Nitrobacter vulgaris]